MDSLINIKVIIVSNGGFYQMKCPECGKTLTKPVKEWDLSPKVHVKMYEHCGKKFREYVKK